MAHGLMRVTTMLGYCFLTMAVCHAERLGDAAINDALINNVASEMAEPVVVKASPLGMAPASALSQKVTDQSPLGSAVVFVSRASTTAQYRAHQQVAKGFEITTLAPFETLILPPGATAQMLDAVDGALPDAVRSVVTWGESALALVEPFEAQAPILAAGLSEPVSGYQYLDRQITYRADPLKLMAKAKELIPALKTVHVVVASDASPWLIDHMQVVLAERGLKLAVHFVGSLREAAQAYPKVLLALNPAEEALWLSPSQPAGAHVFLPLILKSAWKRRIAVVSSQASQVERGVLLGITTDLGVHGAELAGIEKQMYRLTFEKEGAKAEGGDRHLGPERDGSVGQDPSALFASGATRLAINKRAAARLGIQLMPHHIEDIAMVMPLQTQRE